MKAAEKSRCCQLLLVLMLALLLGSATALRAQSGSATAMVPHGSVALVADVPAIHPDSNFDLALHFNLEPGWHIYWSNPGDSGEPPRLVWHLPAGLKAGAIEWPAPKRLPMPGVMDFGYTGDVSLLVPVHAAALPAAKPADLAVQLKIVVCRDLCIPGSAQLLLRLPVGSSGAAQAATQTGSLFSAARSTLPKPAPRTWKVRGQQTKDEFVLDVDSGQSISQAAFFPADEELIDNAADQVVQSTPQGFRIHIKKAENLAHPIAHLRGVIEIPSGAYTLDAPGSAAAPAAKSPAQKSAT